MGRESGLQSWGPAGWKFLHVAAWTYPKQPTASEREKMYAFLHAFAAVLPCSRCRQHWSAFLKEELPSPQDSKLASRAQLTQFLVDGHNAVNHRLGKPLMSYEDASNLYDPERPGPPRPAATRHIAMTISLLLLAAVCLCYVITRHSSLAPARNKCTIFRRPAGNERSRAFLWLTSS